jgi:hypothetical protein
MIEDEGEFSLNYGEFYLFVFVTTKNLHQQDVVWWGRPAVFSRSCARLCWKPETQLKFWEFAALIKLACIVVRIVNRK